MGLATLPGKMSWRSGLHLVWISAPAPKGAGYARGTSFRNWQRVAQGKLPAARKAMLRAAEVLAASTVGAMRRPGILAQPAAEHRETSGTGPYLCPIPEEVMPPV